MRFTGADHAARAYLTLLERASSPRSASLTVTAGRSYAARCPKCRCTDRVAGSSRYGEPIQRCRRCAWPWPTELVEVPRSALGSGGRHDARERQLLTLASLGLYLAKLGTWRRRTLLLYATGAYSVDALAEECARRWPRRVEGWSRYRVTCDLREARQRLERELRRAGVLEEGAA